jgi:predicted nucleic acid-binding protein
MGFHGGRVVYLIDTNIFLEVMLRRSRSLECKELLKMLRDGRVKGVVTDFTVYSIMILLGKLGKLDELRNFLLSLTAYKGLYVYNTSISEKIKAINIAGETGLDIDDAIQYAIALSVNAEAIISFDKHFDNLKIPRKEPKDIVNLKM